MAENGTHFSGEGHLIEGQIEGDPNKTIVPVAVDSDGHLIIDLDASTITIGTVDQGSPNTTANAWPVKLVDAGGVNVAAVNGAGQVAVNVGNFPVTQAVTGPLTDTQLRATPVPVSGTFSPSGTQDVNIVSTIPVPVTDNGGSLTVDGTVAISGSVAVTGPLTDAQLRASAVPVSLTSTTVTGNVTVVQPTGTNLHTVIDSGTVTAAQITSSTATLSNVAGSASSVTILASNASRKMAMIQNDSTSSLYLKFGTTASTSSYTVLMVTNSYYELPNPVYTGRIDGIWLVATGNARVTELT